MSKLLFCIAYVYYVVLFDNVGSFHPSFLHTVITCYLFEGHWPFILLYVLSMLQLNSIICMLQQCEGVVPSDRSQVGITVDIVEWDVEPRCREPSEQRMWPSWCPGPRPSMNHLPTSILNLLGFTAPRKKVGVLQFWHWCTLIFKIFGEAPRVSFWGFFRGELGVE